MCSRLHLSCPLTVALAVAFFQTGCRVKETEIEEQDRFFKEEPTRVPEAHLNQLASEPTAFLRSRAGDPIHWQPWSEELFERARLEQKPIFALITGGNFPRSADILAQLTSDPLKVRILQNNHLCTLVDLAAHPEMGTLAFHLSLQINRPVAFPFMCWFTYEGNAFAWLPLTNSDSENFDTVFDNTTEMVQEMWKDDPRYVVNNSRRDNLKRASQISAEISSFYLEEPDLAGSLERAARQLSALYDPTSGRVDLNGGLVPFSVLQFAATAASHPGSSSHRERLLTMLEGHSELIRTSAIHDPLDGGYFYARQNQQGWSLPVFLKDSGTQLRGVSAYASLSALLDREVMVKAASDTLEFTLRRFGDGDGGIGLFEVPPAESEVARAFLWSRETLQELLPEDEYAVVEKCYNITGIGNIPSEADPRRDYFRLNSLYEAMPAEEAASELGLAPERARELLDAARQRLLVHRREVVDPRGFGLETTRVTATNAHLVSALVEYSVAADDPDSLGRAQAVLKFLRERHYSEAEGLMRIPAIDGRRGVRARGIDYAHLLEALFTLYRHDLNPAHLEWAEQLAREAIETLADEGKLLRETPQPDRLQSIPVHNFAMLYAQSTWGTIYRPLAHLETLTGSKEFAAIRREIARQLAKALESRPILHTDFGIGALETLRKVVVYLDGPLEDETIAAMRHVLQDPTHAAVTVVHLSPALPATFRLPKPSGTVRALVKRAGVEAGTATNAEELRSLLAPSPSSGD